MKKQLGLIIAITLIIVSESYGSWSEFTEVLTSSWGSSAGQIGIQYGDTADSFPQSFGVSKSGNITIADPINEVLHIFAWSAKSVDDIRG